MKIGAAFSDYIYTEKTSFRYKHKNYKTGKEFVMRSWLLPVFLGFVTVVLLGRIFFLQIVRGGQYRFLSDTNRTRTSIIHAPRGIIFDRNDKPLVFNTPGYREIVNGKIQIIDQKTAVSLLAKGDKNLEIDSLRQYPFKDAFSHVIGYIGQISGDELSSPRFQNYKIDDVVGKMGIEQEYESTLKGIDGQTLIEVDATGKQVRVLGQTDPIPGNNITLTIDTFLQQ